MVLQTVLNLHGLFSLSEMVGGVAGKVGRIRAGTQKEEGGELEDRREGGGCCCAVWLRACSVRCCVLSPHCLLKKAECRC